MWENGKVSHRGTATQPWLPSGSTVNASRSVSVNRVALGLPTPAATVEEAHNRLMLTKALDLSAKRKQPVKLPLDPDELAA